MLSSAASCGPYYRRPSRRSFENECIKAVAPVGVRVDGLPMKTELLPSMILRVAGYPTNHLLVTLSEILGASLDVYERPRFDHAKTPQILSSPLQHLVWIAHAKRGMPSFVCNICSPERVIL